MAKNRELPAELTIYAVGTVHESFKGWLRHHGKTAKDSGQAPAPFAVQAGAVTDIDAAGVQLLLSLARSVGERGKRLTLEQPTGVLRAACAALGVPPAAIGIFEEAA